MYLTYAETIRFLKNNPIEELTTNHELIICPSFESLSVAHNSISQTTITLGAQDCSSHESGAFTGQVSAASIAQIGCSYCIVGHSEVKKNCRLPEAEIAQKIQLILKNNMVPIVCIGESLNDYQNNKTISVLEQQLQTLSMLGDTKNKKIIIAYEPIWAIGTNTIPSDNHLTMVYAFLDKYRKTYQNHDIQLVYGGSVDSKTIVSLKKITLIQGFLIGRATTDFQELKNIVLSI